MTKVTKIVLIIAAVCIVLSVLLFSAAVFLGGGDLKNGIETEVFGVNVHMGTDGIYTGNYGNAVTVNSESVAEIREEIDAIEINWTSGSVNFEFGGENITVCESSTDEIDPKDCMICTVENGTLRVRYREDRVEIMDIGAMQAKNLTVTIPENLVPDIKNIRVSTTSADVTLGGFKPDSLKIYSTSGCSFVTDITAGTFIFESTSGDLTLENGSFGNLSAATTSGCVMLKETTSDRAGFDVISGDVTAENCTFGKVEAESTSGSFYMSLNSVPTEFDADTTSGDVEIYLPENAEFNLEFDPTSGDLELEFAAVMRGDEYIVGSGRNEISIETTSGDAYIKVK